MNVVVVVAADVAVVVVVAAAAVVVVAQLDFGGWFLQMFLQKQCQGYCLCLLLKCSSGTIYQVTQDENNLDHLSNL